MILSPVRLPFRHTGGELRVKLTRTVVCLLQQSSLGRMSRSRPRPRSCRKFEDESGNEIEDGLSGRQPGQFYKRGAKAASTAWVQIQSPKQQKKQARKPAFLKS